VNLAPLLQAPASIAVHLATVVPAFGLGLWQIFGSTKGSLSHRAVGAAYLTLMTITAFTALLVHSAGLPHVRLGPFQVSWIHIFVPITLAGVWRSIVAARHHDVAAHKRATVATFIGAMLIAGGFAFAPGRIMYETFFGP
jgi:uncharacterized membrane protein